MTKAAKAVLSKFATAVKAKPTVAKKVATLTRQVKKLSAISYDKVTLVVGGAADAAVIQPYYQYHVSGNMNSWTAIFGSNTADIINLDKIYINSYKMDVRLSQGNESDRIYYTAFVVSLKDSAADSNTFDPATGSLQLLNNVHYQTLPANGQVLLNPKMFTIHSYKRFMMGGRAGDQSTPETRDLSFTIVPKQKLVVNPRGNVLQNAAHTFPKDPSQNYYILLFSDDSNADLATNKVNVGGLVNIAVAS